MLIFCYQPFLLVNGVKKRYTSTSKHGGVRVAIFKKNALPIFLHMNLCVLYLSNSTLFVIWGGGGMFLAFYIDIKYVALFIFIKTNLTSQ